MKKTIKLILLISWMFLIYYMSSLNSDISSNQSGFIVNFISGLLNLNNIDLITYVIRKLAHVFEYLILYILLSINIKELKLKNYEIISFILTIVYSFTDEVHQLFIPGRAGQLQDILIDLIGIMLGYISYILYLRYIKNKKLHILK